MGTTGIWVVGAIPDDEARSLPERIIATVQYRPPLTVPGYADTLAWWSKGGDNELFFEDDPGQPGTLLPTSAALRFAEFIHDANPDTDVSAALRDAVMDLLPAGDDPGLFVSHALRASPAAALWYALGAADAALLPGWFGDFLLTGEEVREVLPRAEQALARTGSAWLLQSRGFPPG